MSARLVAALGGQASALLPDRRYRPHGQPYLAHYERDPDPRSPMIVRTVLRCVRASIESGRQRRRLRGATMGAPP